MWAKPETGRVREGVDAGQQITKSAPSARLKFTNGVNTMKTNLISLGVLWGGGIAAARLHASLGSADSSRKLVIVAAVAAAAAAAAAVATAIVAAA